MKIQIRQAYLLITILLLACQQSFVVQRTETNQFIFESGVAPVDVTLDSFIKPYRDSLNKKVSRVLIYSEKELTKGRSGRNQTPSQLAMGNFMTDACMQIARQQAEKLNIPKPDISIFTWGSVRKSLPAGNVTVNNIYELMPFENEMFVLELNGKQVAILLNQLAAQNDPIAGARVTLGEPNQFDVNGAPLDETKIYHVVASDYLALGGDNLNVLKEASKRYMCGIKVRDGLIQYLETLYTNGETLKPNYEQRIR
jgi:2',3'-cyclic-nucleotide 2'-phosphodiesterase (5'-nucleotidase family)